MGCRNCNFTGRVALTNNDGQVYEFRNCPLCTCKTCDGTGRVPAFDCQWQTMPCDACRPDRFDAHVRLWRKLYDPRSPFRITVTPTYGDPDPAALQRNVEQFVKLNPPPEYYERIYRRCLNPFQRFCRWLTHNPDGSKRNG